MKAAALLWLLVVLAAAVMLGASLYRGVALRSDILALFPEEERNPGQQRINDQVTALLGKRIILLIGSTDRDKARVAGEEISRELVATQLASTVAYHLSGDSLRSLGTTLFRYHDGLLAPADRALLQENRGLTIVNRALANLYGPAPVADRALLREDPFFLFPDFLVQLPVPLPRVHVDDGILSVEDGGKNYVLLVAELAGDSYAIDFEDRLTATLGMAESQLREQIPGFTLLRFGAVFYAHAGAMSLRGETNAISLVSFLGTIALILVVFRALRPLLLGVMSVAVGILCAFAGSLWIFGSLHIIALLFGVSLIGIATDYCLQYLAARFEVESRPPSERLRRVLPAISLGLVTTLIGYLTLVLAPFPGLRQVAVFSAIGLMASFATLVLWLPLLDRPDPLRHGTRMLVLATGLWRFWTEPRWRWAQLSVIGLSVVAGVVGTTRLTIVDDVRRFQTLSPELKLEEAEIRRLTGLREGTEFLVVRGADDEAVLQREEALLSRLDTAQRDGAVSGVEAIAQIVPSIARQRENRLLVHDRLMTPYFADYAARLGLTPAGAPGDPDQQFLTLAAIPENSPLAYLRNLVLVGGENQSTHLILLGDVQKPDALQKIATDVPDTRLADPAGDITRLLGEYRIRAMILLAISAVLMLPVVVWRYGIRGGLRVCLPPVMSVVLTPLLAGLLGVPFTFFGAMALILVLSIGFDYAVFCRESEPSRQATTMVGIWLAMITTLLSFGLLAFSSTVAVRSFGATLLVGTTLAFVFAPLAGTAYGAFSPSRDT
jgi:predicted exporter